MVHAAPFAKMASVFVQAQLANEGRAAAEAAAQLLQDAAEAAAQLLQEQLQAAEGAAQQLQEQLNAATAQKETAEGTAQQLQEQLNAATAQKETAEGAAQQLQEQLNAATAQKETAEGTAQQLQEQLNAATAQQEAAQAAYEQQEEVRARWLAVCIQCLYTCSQLPDMHASGLANSNAGHVICCADACNMIGGAGCTSNAVVPCPARCAILISVQYAAGDAAEGSPHPGPGCGEGGNGPAAGQCCAGSRGRGRCTAAGRQVWPQLGYQGGACAYKLMSSLLPGSVHSIEGGGGTGGKGGSDGSIGQAFTGGEWPQEL